MRSYRQHIHDYLIPYLGGTLLRELIKLMPSPEAGLSGTHGFRG